MELGYSATCQPEPLCVVIFDFKRLSTVRPKKKYGEHLMQIRLACWLKLSVVDEEGAKRGGMPNKGEDDSL